MDPNIELVISKLDALTQRLEERWERRFTDLDRYLVDRSPAMDERLASVESSLTSSSTALTKRILDLECAPSDPFAAKQALAMESRISTMEANYSDRDAEFAHRLSELESVRTGLAQQDRDARISNLEEVTTDLASWRQKFDKRRDREMLDEMSTGPGLLPTPTTAVARSPAGLPATRPVVGHRNDLSPRDLGSGVVTTWISVPAKEQQHNSVFMLGFWILLHQLSMEERVELILDWFRGILGASWSTLNIYMVKKWIMAELASWLCWVLGVCFCRTFFLFANWQIIE